MKTDFGKLQSEYEYYQNHLDDLVKNYHGKFIVIHQQRVVGEYDSMLDAYDDSMDKFELGSFLIMECLPPDEAKITTYNYAIPAT